MLARRRRWGAAALAVALCPGIAYGWSAESRERILDDAMRLSPPVFSRILVRHREQCRIGAAVEAAEASSPRHALTPNGEGQAGAELIRCVDETIAALSRHEPMRQVCLKAGRICHLVADLNNPLHTGALDLRASDYYDDFCQYMHSVVTRTPLVFYGWRDDPLAAGDMPAFLREIVLRSARDAELIKRSYYPAGQRVPSSTFDDRSIPFAIASLAYSRAVSDTANLWFYVWSRAGGDVRGTPYRTVHGKGD